MRRPQTPEPELQQQAPEPATTTTTTTTTPAPVVEEAPRTPTRSRFPSRGPPTSSRPDQFRAPLVPSRAAQPIVEIPAPELSTTTVPPSPEVREAKVKDNFARQKSINDLYALTRLHQLAINTRVPNKKHDGAPNYKGN